MPHRCEAVRVGQLRLRLAVSAFVLARLGFRPLSLGNVPCQRNTPALELSHADLDGELGSVLSTVTALEGEDFSGAEALPHALVKHGFCVRVEVSGSHSDQFVPAIAQAFGG